MRIAAMAWIYLLLAGLFEIGWPVGLKIAQDDHTRILGVTTAVACMAASGFCSGLPKSTSPLERLMRCEPGSGLREHFLWEQLSLETPPAWAGIWV